jgi:1-acyl-sn-glycerol-3-phosphate acyltransferase
MERVYAPVIAVVRTVFRAQGLRFTIVGEDNVPRSGGAVMAINHTGYFDFTYAGLGALKSKRYVRFMAKQSIFQHKFAGPLMRGMKHIPVDRKNGGASFREALVALKAGEIVGVFPEATMSRSFELKEFKSGAARMARDAGVPLLPTTLWGAHRVWTKDAPKHRGRSRIPIFIEVGEPIWVERGGDVEEATARLKAAMQEQLDRQQRAYPTLTGEDRRFLPARLGGTAPTPEQAAAADLRDMTRTHDEFNS